LQDAKVLQSSKARLSHVLPLLQEYHGTMLQELENEKLVVEEIESGNLQQLDELKDTISEQKRVPLSVNSLRLTLFCSGILEEYHTRLSEARSTLESLRERLSEMISQRAMVQKDIESFQGKITLQTSSTCSGVLKIKGLSFQLQT
jgi:hypothetical protein